MNKKLRIFLTVLLAVCAAVCTVLGLTACGGSKLKSISVENARTEFRIGDEFELGEGFAVYAHYSDGKTADVTAEATITKELGFDMDVAGDYLITVGYGGKKEVYKIFVGDFERILRKIEVDTANVKTEYELGDEISYDGLKVKCTYENAQGELIPQTTSSLKKFKVTVTGPDGEACEGILDELGEYTVKVSLSDIVASFKVTVAGINISSVQGALAAGKAFHKEVVSGTQKVENSTKKYTDTLSASYTYKFGDNYTYVKESVINPVEEFHYTMDGDSLFTVHVQGGTIIPNQLAPAAAMDGAPCLLWYSYNRVYGIESTLIELYKHAKICTNGDLIETKDESKREYTFKFSGLEFRANSSDYYETRVSFKLGEKYNIERAEFTQDYWENNDTYAGGEGYSPTFITENGITRPNDSFTHRTHVTVEQVTGKRTETFPYSSDAFKVQSYKLMFNGKEIGENDAVECSVSPNGDGSHNITLTIEDIQPSTVDFAQDTMYFDYEGNTGGPAISTTMMYAEGFMAYRSGNKITIRPRNGGVWKLILKTSLVTKTVTLDIAGLAPASMSAQLGNPVTGNFSSGNSAVTAIGGEIYFRGEVDKYANTAVTAAVASSNSATATIEETTLGGQKCFKFKASAAGTYTVTVTSKVASTVKCTFTFTVNEMPDFENILTGKYTAEDSENVYDFEFTPQNEGGKIKGTVVITKTPTDEDGTPITAQAVTQTLEYNVDFDNVAIVLTAVSGPNLGVDLSVSIAGVFEMENQYGYKYTLNRVQG